MLVIQSCRECGCEISGARQKRFCLPCKRRRNNSTTRYLHPGEKVPDHEPLKYLSEHGYIRLRWKVAPKLYVEAYEHRVRDGFVTEAEHVHHINHIKTDNRPENLRELSPRDHAIEHGRIAYWVPEADRLYRDGLSTYEIAKVVGRNPATVYRKLLKAGTPIRKEARVAIPHREQGDLH